MPELRAHALFQQFLRAAGMSDERAWSQSSFLGLVEIVEVITPDDDLPDDLTEHDEFLCGSVDDVFLWRVERRWPFARPVPCHGMLNLWRPPKAVHAVLDEQLAAAGRTASDRQRVTRRTGRRRGGPSKQGSQLSLVVRRVPQWPAEVPLVWRMLDERTRRLMAASEALALPYGGVSAVHRACGLSRKAIAKGIREIQRGAVLEPGAFGSAARDGSVSPSRTPICWQRWIG